MSNNSWTTKRARPLSPLTYPHAILNSSKQVIAIRYFPETKGNKNVNVIRIPDDIPVTLGWYWTGRYFRPPFTTGKS